MCTIIRGDKHALSEQQVGSLIEEADRLGFDEYEISGGEPSYLPYFRRLLEDYAGNTRMTLKICTNAFQLDDALISSLAGRRHLLFRVSFDGTGAIHNAIRVQSRYDAFTRSDRNIRLLAQAGIAVSINTVIQRHNVGNILETYGVHDLLGGLRSGGVRDRAGGALRAARDRCERPTTQLGQQSRRGAVDAPGVWSQLRDGSTMHRSVGVADPGRPRVRVFASARVRDRVSLPRVAGQHDCRAR
jgi:hypothetical protein